MCRGPFHAAEHEVEITQSDGARVRYDVAGTIDLEPGGTPVSLTVLHGEGDDLFLPFTDATSGAGTYGGGRYAPVERHPDGTATVDFNRSVNPLCAYDPEFSCPLPPARNRIPVAVEAGERDYTRRSAAPDTAEGLSGT